MTDPSDSPSGALPSTPHGAPEQGPQSGDRITRRQWLTLLVLSLGLAIVIIDGTIVNVAIPSIQQRVQRLVQRARVGQLGLLA